jgi:hypothetical protein
MEGQKLKELGDWVAKIKERGTGAVETARLKLKQSSLEKKISRFHTKLGERVEYVLGLEKGNLEEDDVVKGFLQEIGDIRKEIEELERKIEALKSAETEDSQEIEGTNEEKEVTEGEGED